MYSSTSVTAGVFSPPFAVGSSFVGALSGATVQRDKCVSIELQGRCVIKLIILNLLIIYRNNNIVLSLSFLIDNFAKVINESITFTD